MDEIGSTLREARMRARIDISEVEARTKIRAKYLRAIENEEWDLLPGTIYVKSFLRTYGDFLGLDSRLLIDEYKRRYERPDDHDARAKPTTQRDRERDRGRRPSRRRISGPSLGPKWVIGIALIAIVVALYVIGRNNDNNTSSDGASITPANGGHHTSTTHKKKTKPKSSTTPITTTTQTQTSTTPTVATLKIVPTSLVWVCVEDGSGKPLVPGLDYEANEKIPEQKSSELLVSLGNDDVSLTVNGKPYQLKATPPFSLKITPKGVTALATAPTCST